MSTAMLERPATRPPQAGAAVKDAPARLMTTNEMLALPPDPAVTRTLHWGELREEPMTIRNRRHSRTEGSISKAVGNWADTIKDGPGEVLVGEGGVILARDPDLTVGVDVAWIDAATAAANPEDNVLLEGVPVLVVEVMSLSDTVDGLFGKVDDYLAAGVKVVWLVNPYHHFVIVYEQGRGPRLFNAGDTLDGGEHLPGFSAVVRDLLGLPREER